MGHRHKNLHKSRHHQHANKPKNLSQGSRVIKSTPKPHVGLAEALPETVLTAAEETPSTAVTALITE